MKNTKYLAQGFSIVLCTFNGRERIKTTLEYTASLTIPKDYSIELIVVDNASTDNTHDYSYDTWQGLGSPFPITIIHEPKPGQGHAVETGYDAANFSLIISLDDDVWLSSDYLLNAIELFKLHPNASILQGLSTPAFESKPPKWLSNPLIAKQFVIQGAFSSSRYFPHNYFYVWGAGLIFKTEDWLYLRKAGLSFLCSKSAGKSAGVDSELGLGLYLLGRKAYFSTKLNYQHFMPESRLTWSNLKNNFYTLGLVNINMYLYKFIIHSMRKKNKLHNSNIIKYLILSLIKQSKHFTLKQYFAYFIKPNNEYYQLMMTSFFSSIYHLIKYLPVIRKNVRIAKHWILPISKDSTSEFTWPE